MKPKREEQLYQETRAAIEAALGFRPGESRLPIVRHVGPGGAFPQHWLTLQLEWGRPKCCVRLSRDDKGAVQRLHVTVRPHWLERVHQQGLTMVDGVLVLHAEPWPPPEPAEAAWLCHVCSHKADWSEAEPALLCVVRYGGILRGGVDQHEALYRAIRDYANALGVDPPEEAKVYLDKKGADLLAQRKTKGGHLA